MLLPEMHLTHSIPPGHSQKRSYQEQCFGALQIYHVSWGAWQIDGHMHPKPFTFSVRPRVYEGITSEDSVQDSLTHGDAECGSPKLEFVGMIEMIFLQYLTSY